MSAEYNHILLSDENMKSYGFSRYHFPGEADIENNIWHRNIGAISVKGKQTPVNYINIPKSLLIPLSLNKGNRLIDLPAFSIQQNFKDILPMKLLCERAGWNQTEEDLINFLDIAEDANFLATIDVKGSPISLGCGAIYFIGNDICWISMILVHPEVRRQGIARAIMEHCIDYIQSKDIPVTGLDASEMGLGLYESMGFKESSKVWRSKISTSEKIATDSAVEIIRIEDISTCLPFMKMRCIDDKLDLYKLLVDSYQGTNYAAISGNTIVGILMGRPGRRFPFIGPLIADNAEIAMSLLNHALDYWKGQDFSEVFMDIPENHFKIPGKIISGNPGTVSFPEHHSFFKSVVPVRGFIRMYYLDSHPGSEKTIKYMKKENEQILPFLYGIGGPELS